MRQSYFYPDVPLMNSTVNPETRETYLQMIRSVHAGRLWLAVDTECLLQADRSADMAALRENIRFFRENDVETGVWIQGLGFGTPTEERYRHLGWTRIRSVTGKSGEVDAYCPEDPAFRSQYLRFVTDVAACGPQLIQLDDDLCLSVRPGIGCFCHRHLRLMSDRLGEELELDGLPEKLFTGGRNRYRDAWLDTCGESLRAFCQDVHDAVAAVDATIRVGFCAGYTSWDIEGIDALSLTKVLAGENKPFLRFTGAPYWCNATKTRFPGQKLNAVIECAREQLAWCRDSGVEVYGEADSYPRPAYHVQASLIENFDIALQAQGVKSLKYLFDYVSSPGYEQKYLKMHLRNTPLYEHIVSTFDTLQDTGVRLYRNRDRIRTADLGPVFPGEKPIMRIFFSAAAAMLTQLSIPVCYTGEARVGAAFGEDVLAIPEGKLPEKLILDLPGALLLQSKGVDLGITAWSPCEASAAEVFPGIGEQVRMADSGLGLTPQMNSGFYQVRLSDRARVQSEFVYCGGNQPASCRCRAGNTEFLILLFDAAALGQSSSAEASYCRQRQLLDFIGGRWPAITCEPGIYALCKQSADGKQLAVLFENLGHDPVFDFEIELGRRWARAELYGGEGALSPDGTRMRVSTDFNPGTALVLTLT